MYEQQGMVVTPIDDLVKMSQGTLVELPPFVKGQPFVAQLKRPSMLALVRAGKIAEMLASKIPVPFLTWLADTHLKNKG